MDIFDTAITEFARRAIPEDEITFPIAVGDLSMRLIHKVEETFLYCFRFCNESGPKDEETFSNRCMYCR